MTTAAVTYSRVSSGRQADNGTSLATQREDMIAYAKRKGWKILKHYEDAGKTATTKKGRHGLNAALAHVQRTGCIFLAYDDSRLNRNSEEHKALFREVRAAGGEIALVCRMVEKTAEGNLMSGIKGEFDEYNSAKIGEGVKRANDQTCKDVAEGGRGYRTQGSQKTGAKVENGRRVAVSAELAIIEKIDALSADNLSDAQIAAQLNRDHVPTISAMRSHKRQAALWSRGLVRNLLPTPPPA